MIRDEDYIYACIHEFGVRLKIPGRIQKRLEKQSMQSGHARLSMSLAVKKIRTSSLLRSDDKEQAILSMVKTLLGEMMLHWLIDFLR